MKIVRNNLKIIVAFIALILFLIIAKYLLKDQLSYLDNNFYSMLSHYINPENTRIMKIITKFSNAITVISICLSCLFIFHNKYTICMILNVFITSLLNLSLKDVFLRQRPIKLSLIKETGYSFPSGHSMASISLYGFLMYLAYKKIKNKFLKIITCLLLGVLIIVVCISRVYLGVHYISDVIAGFLIATTVLMLFITLSNRIVKY